MPDPNQISSTSWLQPMEEQAGLKRYVETIRERLPLIVLITVLVTGIAVLYVVTAQKTYDATADLLITPVNSDDPVSTSLGLIGQSADPTRDVETASRLVTNTSVAELVRQRLASEDTAQEILEDVVAQPIAQSNFVAVTASAGSPEGAKALADAFAEEAITLRTEQLHDQIDTQLPRLEAQAAQSSGSAAESLDTEIAQLKVLQSGPDPTMRVATLATEPTSQASPKPLLSVIGGVIAGLVLGIAAAFTAQVLDPRLRREAQLRRLYRLPILGRIPKEVKPRSDDRPLGPQRLAPVTAEAYRTLRTTLARNSSPQGGRVILVTGSSPSEGKTTTAINLATSFALSGRRVILIESDLRRPVLGDALGAQPFHGGVVSVLIEKTSLGQALTQTQSYGPNLQLLLADYEGGWITELFSIPTAERMIEDARRMADYVIVDSPPLNEVVDALPLARLADDVLVVVRLGATRLDKLRQLGELLAENDVRPAGFTVIGTPRPRNSEYHYYAGERDHATETALPRGMTEPPAAS